MFPHLGTHAQMLTYLTHGLWIWDVIAFNECATICDLQHHTDGRGFAIFETLFLYSLTTSAKPVLLSEHYLKCHLQQRWSHIFDTHFWGIAHSRHSNHGKWERCSSRHQFIDIFFGMNVFGSVYMWYDQCQRCLFWSDWRLWPSLRFIWMDGIWECTVWRRQWMTRDVRRRSMRISA